MPPQGFVTFDIASLGTYVPPLARSQLVFNQILVRDLTLAKSRTHPLTAGQAKLLADLENFAAGFFAGAGDGGWALLGDLAANTIPFVGDIRDILIQLYHGISGEGIEYSQIGFSVLGIVLDFVPFEGEVAGFCLGVVKRALRRFAKPEFRKGIMAVGKKVAKLCKELASDADAAAQIAAIANVLLKLLMVDRETAEAWGESLGSEAEQILLAAALISRANNDFLDVLIASLDRVDASRRLVETLSTPRMLVEAKDLSGESLGQLVDVLERVSDAAPANFARIVTNQLAVGSNYPFSKLIETAWIVRDTAGLDLHINFMANPTIIAAEGRRYELDVAAYFVTNGQPIPRMGKLFAHGSFRSDLDLSNGIAVQVKKASYEVGQLKEWFAAAKRKLHLAWTDIYYVSTLSEAELGRDGTGLFVYMRRRGIKYQQMDFIPSN